MGAEVSEVSGSVPLVEQADLYRFKAKRKLNPERRSELGQFLTPGPIAAFMASLFEELAGDMRLLEAGAGVGTLLAAVVAEATTRAARPRGIDVGAFELDPILVAYLEQTLAACKE